MYFGRRSTETAARRARAAVPLAHPYFVPGRAGSQVGAEVMAPLGIMLMQQSWWSVDCTDPSHKPDLVEGWGE